MPALVALTGTFLAVAMGLLQLGPWSRLLAERFEQLAQLQGGARAEMWRAAWDLARGAPWLGTGPDTFALMFPAHETVEYFRIEWGRQPLHAHSLPVHLVATRGMLAGASLLLILWGAVTTIRRTRSAPETVSVSLAVLFGCGVASLFGSPSVTGALWLVFALAGLASQNAFLGATSAVRQRSKAERGESGRDATHTTARASLHAAAHPPWIIRVAPAGVLLVILAFAVWEARASWAAQRAERIRHVDRALGIEFARRARAMLPFDENVHRIHVESLLFSLEKGNVPEVRNAAVHAADELVRRWPRRAMNHQRRALAQLAVVLSGDSTALGSMDSSFVRAAALAPNNALFTVERARALRLTGQHHRAHALLEPLTRRYPERGLPWAELAEVHFAQNDLQAAHACLLRAVEGRWREQHLALHRAQQRLRQLETSPR